MITSVHQSRGCSGEIGAPVGVCWRGAAYAPERWETDETGAPHDMEQVWFSGSDADVGGICWGMNQRGPCPIFPLFG